MAESPVTTIVIVNGTGTCDNALTPASPLNSVSSAPRLATRRAAVAITAQKVPKCSRMSRACPLPLTMPEPQRKLLHDIKERHQEELQRQEPVAPFGAALSRGDHAAGITVGEHHHDAWPRDCKEAAGAANP